MSEKPIHVRTALMPAFYKDFHCIMGACQDTCCAGWKIEFDKKDYLIIKRAPKSAELEQLLEGGMVRLREQTHDDMYAKLCGSRGEECSLHTPEGLCRLQLECGEEALPKVCRTYPRIHHYTPATLEYSLTPSCEGVLALLWDLKEGVDFIEESISREKYRAFYPENAMESRFGPVRELWIDTLQTRALPLSRRVLLIGLMTQKLMGLDWSDGPAIDRALSGWRALLQNPDLIKDSLEKMSGNQQMFISNNLQLLLKQLNTLGTELTAELLSAVAGVNSLEALDLNRVVANSQRYQELEEKLDELLGHSEHFLENLMVTAVYNMGIPGVDAPEKMWKSYVSLCNLYSFYRFASVCAMDKEASKARLFHVLVYVGRSLLHNSKRQNQLRDELFENHSATLAHMAILVGG